MANSSSEFIGKVQTLRANPAAMQRLMLRTLEKATNGEVVIVDPTNPFVYMLESACTMATAAMLQNETLARKQYASNAISSDELYRHMADIDYLNRFATPAQTVITMLLSLDEVKLKAVAIPDGSGTKRLVIPRHTQINVGGYSFTLQYPIYIEILSHGGISVLYNNDNPSPLYSLETNRVDWSTVRLNDITFLRIPINVKQMAILSQMAQLNSITGFKREFEFKGNYYYTRAFIKNTLDSQWVEIKTTHSEQVYDITTPTVVLKVIDNVLRVVVPQIYFTNAIIKDSIRLDIYTTNGVVDVNLSSFDPTAYTVNWLDYDMVSDSPYVSPLFTFSGLLVFSDKVISGGKVGVSFDDLREQVISRSLGNSNLPITNAQLITNAESQGYDIVTNLDNITNRQFLATRGLPPPTNGSTVSGAGCTILTLQSSIANLITHATISDNNRRVTIRPETLFKNNNGMIEVVPDTVITNLLDPLTTTPDGVAIAVNAGNYLYTPFHYVLDTNSDIFDVRAYNFTKPSVLTKFFHAANSTLGIEISTKDWVLETNPTGAGFVLAVQVQTSATLLELPVDSLNLQISYLQPNSSNRVYINGTLVIDIDPLTGRPLDDMYVYHFPLDTDYDVDENHSLILEPFRTPVALTTEFDLVYIIKNISPFGVTTSDIESYYDATTFDNYDFYGVYYGVTQEKLTLNFGSHLDYLWTRSRSVVSESHFLKYTADVPAVYSAAVYLRDTAGNLVLQYDTNTSTYTFTTIHEAGEPVLNVTGQDVYDAALLATPNLTVLDWWASLDSATRLSYQAYAHRKGDNVLDANGQPVLIDPYRDMIRQIDLLLIDGRYYFATEQATTNYRTELVNQLTDWMLVDIANLSAKLLEQSEMFFYPKSTIGEMDVIVGAGLNTRIDASQRLAVEYHMLKEKMDNPAIREAITTITGRVLAESLQATTISVSDMIDALKLALGNDIVSVQITGFANNKYSTITVKDQSVRPSIGKQLVSLSNLTLAVRDDIAIDFISHK